MVSSMRASTYSWFPHSTHCLHNSNFSNNKAGISVQFGAANWNVRCHRDPLHPSLLAAVFRMEKRDQSGNHPGASDVEKLRYKGRSMDSRIGETTKHNLECFVAPQRRQSARNGAGPGIWQPIGPILVKTFVIAVLLSVFGKGKGRVLLFGWSISMYFVFQMIYILIAQI